MRSSRFTEVKRFYTFHDNIHSTHTYTTIQLGYHAGSLPFSIQNLYITSTNKLCDNTYVSHTQQTEVSSYKTDRQKPVPFVNHFDSILRKLARLSCLIAVSPRLSSMYECWQWQNLLCKSSLRVYFHFIFDAVFLNVRSR